MKTLYHRARAAYPSLPAAAALRSAQVPEWQPIETLPTNRMVMLWFNNEQAMAMGYRTDKCRGPNSVVIDGAITFADAWMPLPSAPSEYDVLNSQGDDP